MASTPSSPSDGRGGRGGMTASTSDAALGSPAPQRSSLYAASKLPASWGIGARRLSTSSTGSNTPSVSGRTDASAGANTVSSSSKASNLFQQTTTALQNFAIESIISASAAPPRLPISQTKEPLSLPTTTKNFRGFVQKSGPIFFFQDGVQATLVWQDTSWTLMWMAIWAVISIYPWTLVLMPSTVLAFILISTHRARFEDPMTTATKAKEAAAAAAAASSSSPSKASAGHREHSKAQQAKRAAAGPTPADVLEYSTGHPTKTGEGDVKPPLVPNPPHEGSIKYYENLRDIQNMMRLVIDGYDAIAPLVPYLNWSSYTRSLHVFQLSILVTALLFFVAPYIPYRLVLFLAGEGAFILNHPWTLPALQGVGKRINSSREGRRMVKLLKEGGHRLREWVEQDRLDDDVWEKGWRNVEMFENERFQPTNRASSSSGLVGGWSAHNLNVGERRPWTKGADGWSSDDLDVIPGASIDISRQVSMTLEAGWAWIPSEDWRIDWGGSWSSVGVDDEGYVYTDSSWQKPSPYPYGHGGGVPDYPPSIFDLIQDEGEDEGEEAEGGGGGGRGRGRV
ncbi:uncharacterized protein PFL1_04919 [Pseudozyma flocculosa PF-1]|uniref:TECPR1-like DysF domain-containing protein n=1 Tax=Pseudozyma flocculosa PF-1 TaxID=1277687 RepID=A0A061H5U5_9BASI|nr:uncharacterized protein PFL1_04919 [Pseudozyma flocculosa PF-1]EPQ27380.1 hypothetical protein PFL1_04919 [Pseudozyma flocculosa PF-1]